MKDQFVLEIDGSLIKRPLNLGGCVLEVKGKEDE